MANFNVDVNATISDGSIANAKLADMNEATIKGRAAGAGSGSPQDLTASQARTALGLGTAATQDSTAFDAAGSAAAAQAAAISAAATDATTKANAAQSAAISTASTDATNKANAAQAAAIAASQPLDPDLTAIAGLSPSNDDVIQRKAGAWTNRTPAQLIADLGALGTTFAPLFNPSYINFTGAGTSTTNNTATDIHSSADLSIPAAGLYLVAYGGTYAVPAVATGAGFTLRQTGLSPALTIINVMVDAGTGDRGAFPWSSFGNIVASASSRSATNSHFTIYALFRATASGTIIPQYASETNGQAVTINSLTGFFIRIA